MPIVKGTAEVNGTTLYFEMCGEGMPLVLIHSGLLDNRMWDEQVTAFEKEYQVIRYDVRGHGQSGKITEPYRDVEDLYSLLQFLNIERAHILGLSMGGRIASDFAITHPERVEKLVLAASAVSGYNPSAEAQADEDNHLAHAAYSELQKGNRERAVEILLATPKWMQPRAEMQEKLREWFITSDYVTWRQADQILQLQPPAVGRLKEVQAPTLLIYGTRDNVAIQEISKHFEHGIADIRTEDLANVGHLPNLEQPDTFNRLVLEFLRDGSDNKM